MGVPRARSCCFCLSLRFGVFVIATIGLIGGFALFVTSAVTAHKSKGHLSTGEKFQLYLHIIVYLAVAIFSGVGLYGTIRLRRGLVSGFFTILLTHFTFSVSTGILSLRDIFRKGGSTALDKCLQAAKDQATKDSCEKGVGSMKKPAVAILIFYWLFQIYALWIVKGYEKQMGKRDTEEDEFLNPTP